MTTALPGVGRRAAPIAVSVNFFFFFFFFFFVVAASELAGALPGMAVPNPAGAGVSDIRQ
jgi:hypothetical protein